MDEYYTGWVVRYENGFITKTVDYINTIGSDNRIVSKKEYRYQVWINNVLFLDSFLDTSDGTRLILNWKEEEMLDPDYSGCQKMQDYQHELDVDGLISYMDDHFIWGVDLGAKTHKVDGTAVKIPEGFDSEPYDITHYDDPQDPTIYWDGGCDVCSGTGAMILKHDKTGVESKNRCYCIGFMKKVDENMQIMIDNGDISIHVLNSTSEEVSDE